MDTPDRRHPPAVDELLASSAQTLLLRLAGPMQSWGTQSRFLVREAGSEPSKSGVIGLLCAALGRPRHESVADLAALRFGVRIDHAGVVRRDYHTVGAAPYHRVGPRATGLPYGIWQDGKVEQSTVLSYRYALHDASFLVGLEGSPALLRTLEEALADPVWGVYLGRKAFVPSVPILLPPHAPHGPGRRVAPLLRALASVPWTPWGRSGRAETAVAETRRLRCIIDADPADLESEAYRDDVPVSFRDRTFASRAIQTVWIEVASHDVDPLAPPRSVRVPTATVAVTDDRTDGEIQ